MKPPNTSSLVEPSTRSFADWSPDLVRSARAMADAGNLALAADLCEAMMGDDRVMAALNTRCRGLVSLPLTFDAARGTKRLVKALEAGEDWWTAFSEDALAQLLAWGNLLGVGLGKLAWTDRGSAINRLVPVLEIWHPKHLRFDWNKRAWFVKLADGTETEVTPGDGKWVLYTPYGAHRPWAFGAWRAIALWFLLKQYAINDWARYSERHGQGTVTVESPEGSDKEKRKELAAGLKELGREGVVVLPPGFKFDLVEATANTWETFQAQKNAADLGTAVALVGQNMSTEVTGPVGTGATLHGRVLQIYIDSDAETLATCLHAQALVWWAEFNFGSRDLAPWPNWDTKPPANKKEQADLASTLSKVGAFTVNEVRAAAGYEPLEEGGDELVKPAPAIGAPAAANDGAGDAAKTMRRVLRRHRRRMAALSKAVHEIGAASSSHGEAARSALEQVQAATSALEQLHARHIVLETRFADFSRSTQEGEVRNREQHDNLASWQRDDRTRTDALTAQLSKLGADVESFGRSVADLSSEVRQLRDEHLVHLRSGRVVTRASGIVEGQLYADAVADATRERAAKVLDDDVVAVLEAIDAGESFDDIRKRLVKTFKGMSPKKLAKLTEAAITMAELGGRHATNEDGDED